MGSRAEAGSIFLFFSACLFFLPFFSNNFSAVLLNNYSSVADKNSTKIKIKNHICFKIFFLKNRVTGKVDKLDKVIRSIYLRGDFYY